MDMNTRNSRQLQEDGVFVPLCDQYTGDPIDPGPKAPGFLVRGIAARSVQMRFAEAALAAKQAKKAGRTDDEVAQAALEKMHAAQIDAAMKYIIDARNMTIGVDPVTTPEQIRAVLDMTFPDMQLAKDDAGKPVMTTMKDDDGNDVTVPKFEIVGMTYAGQVIEAAENQRNFLGRQPTG